MLRFESCEIHLLTSLSLDLVATSTIIPDLSDNSDAVPVFLWPVRLAAPVSQRHSHLGHLLPRLNELLEGGASLRAASFPTECHHKASQYGTFATYTVVVEVVVGVGIEKVKLVTGSC